MRHTRAVFCFAFVLSLFVSCKKDKDEKFVEIADASTGGNTKTVTMEYSAGNQIVDAITLKNSGSDVVHVKLALDDPALEAAKAKKLPAGNFSITNLEFDIPAKGSTNVPITIINRNTIPMDTTYALAFKIESVSKGNITPNGQSMVVRFDLRNKFDGRYRITGTFVDIAAPTLTFTEHVIDVITVSPTQVKFIPVDLGIEGYLILSGTSLSYYGSFGPVLTFNPTTNKLTAVTNHYGQPASNTRSAEIDPSGSNLWDPTSKSIIVKFYMKQPNTVTSSPYIRVYFNNTLINQGKRFN